MIQPGKSRLADAPVAGRAWAGGDEMRFITLMICLPFYRCAVCTSYHALAWPFLMFRQLGRGLCV